MRSSFSLLLAVLSLLWTVGQSIADTAAIRIVVSPGRKDWAHSPVSLRVDSLLRTRGWTLPLLESTISVRTARGGAEVPSRAAWSHRGEDPAVLLFAKTGTGRREYEILVSSSGSDAVRQIPVVGLGEPLTYGRTGVVAGIDGSFNSNLTVCDWDGDGDNDFFVAQGQGGGANWTMHGVHYYENIGSSDHALMAKPRVVFADGSTPHAVDWNADGLPDLIVNRMIYRRNVTPGYMNFAQPESLAQAPPISCVTDWNGDGLADIVESVSFGGGDPSRSIWSKQAPISPFTADGVWRGYVSHGRIVVHRNTGTAQLSEFSAEPETLRVAVDFVEVPGGGTPAFGDIDGDGDVDMLLGTTHDLFYFENTGTRSAPRYARGYPLDLHLEEIYVRPFVADMNGDAKVDVLIAQENGDVKYAENLGIDTLGRPRFAPITRIPQVDPLIDLGSVGTFDVADVNRDGKPDIVGSNSYGEVWQWLSRPDAPPWVFETGTRVAAGGYPIRIFAGNSGSIQGPGEARYGYGAPEVADWDEDGITDLVVTDVWGKHRFYRGEQGGIASEGLHLAVEQPVRFADAANAIKPVWNWWNPIEGELVTAWRTRPEILDWDGDGVSDYVSIDHEGYLGLFAGSRTPSGKRIGPLRRAFLNDAGDPLMLNPGTCGNSGRFKITLADWDRDGDLDMIRGVATPTGNTMHTQSAETGCAFFYENIGGNRFAFRGEMVPDSTVQIAGHSSCPQPYDFDGDGTLDLLVGGEDGHIFAFHRAYLENDLPKVDVTSVRIDRGRR
jgi:hypothetical protein